MCSRTCIWVWQKGVRGLRGQESKLGCNATGERRAAKEAAELAEREAIHPSLLSDDLIDVEEKIVTNRQKSNEDFPTHRTVSVKCSVSKRRKS